MGRIYHKCHFCGGDVVLKGVPAGVCQVCGEKYFKAEVVKKMEQTAISSEKVEEKIQVPILELRVV
ncbi:MAG: YgiT-type zinc finger protein [Proteobacteria bacterium]|nr:YgiT-type zinc finger protein [Pseudomonadota bacterium]